MNSFSTRVRNFRKGIFWQKQLIQHGDKQKSKSYYENRYKTKGPFSLNKAKTFRYLSIDQKFNLPSIVLVQAMKDLLH